MVNLQDYIINSNLFKTIKIDDLLFVEYKCLIDDPQSNIWTHANYIAYVLGGEKKWKTPNNICHLHTGEALFVKKGANTVYQYFNEPFIVLFTFIPDHFIRHVILKHPELALRDNNSNNHDNTLIRLSMNTVLDSFFQSLLAHFSQETTYTKNVLQLKMEELILNLLTQPGNNQLKQYFTQLIQHQKVDLADIMNANFHQPLSLNDYARLCARSLSSFRRDFNRIFGTTPAKWIIEKRLEYSCFLLETTRQSINEIIDNCGFTNRSHFMKAFKHVYGISPNKFRTSSLNTMHSS